ncbi:unnamed protein product [Lampetra fluviatilis]
MAAPDRVVSSAGTPIAGRLSTIHARLCGSSPAASAPKVATQVSDDQLEPIRLCHQGLPLLRRRRRQMGSNGRDSRSCLPVAMKLLLFATLVAGLHAANLGPYADPRYVNNYDQLLNFNCPSHQSISQVQSIHDNGKEDRIWDFRCKGTFDTSRTVTCTQSNYVNNFDEAFSFTCPFHSALNGMESYHDNGKEDRRWKYNCCAQSNVCFSECLWTDYVNNWDEQFSWTVPDSYFLAGVSSYHDNGKEDRRWKYHFCKKISC